MMMPYLFWILGLVLIFLEFYLPGAILGILGGIALITSVIMHSKASGSPLSSALFLLGVISSVVLLVRFTLWRIRTAKPGYSIYSHGDQTGYFASNFDKAAIGKEGIVLSDLKPGGYILIEGKQHQAISQSGYLVKGTTVIVISGQEESLIVKRK